MNRLGLSPQEAAAGRLDGLMVETLMIHLACADEPAHALNRRQLQAFSALRQAVPANAYSLANSAGICLRADYAFDLTRPGFSIYGGVQEPELEGHIRQVARPVVEPLPVREISAGDRDRKSFVQGRVVSVLDDLGCGRYIKKNQI